MNSWVVRLLLAGGLAMAATTGWTDEYSDGWGPAVGSQLPILNAVNQDGEMQSLERLAGERGLLLFMSRSADW